MVLRNLFIYLFFIFFCTHRQQYGTASTTMRTWMPLFWPSVYWQKVRNASCPFSRVWLSDSIKLHIISQSYLFLSCSPLFLTLSLSIIFCFSIFLFLSLSLFLLDTLSLTPWWEITLTVTSPTTVDSDEALHLVATSYYRSGKPGRAYSILRARGTRTPQLRFLMARCCYDLTK